MCVDSNGHFPNITPTESKNRGMSDPIITYRRIIEDLERIAAATPRERLDPRLWHEINELKQELANHGYVYLDGYERPFCLVPAIRKCYRCGKTKGCKHRAAITN